jgi:hypothetical protein
VAERRRNLVSRLPFMLAMAVLGLAAIEMGMRYLDWPRSVISGWRTANPGGPVNQLGWRGQHWQPHRQTDFVIVMTGGVECTECPPDETLDVILEHALRQYSPKARVVTLGSRGYSEDQEYLALHEYFAHERADLVVTWASIAEDVPANMFRGVRTPAGPVILKPTFAWLDNDIRGPSDVIGEQVYNFKLSALLRPIFINLDSNWTRLLPAADPGASSPPPGITARLKVDDALEDQRTPWAIWMTPRPARVKYGIDLTRGLFRHMRELATLHGAKFTVLLTPPETHTEGPVALEHSGHWFVADPAARDAAIAEVTNGFDTITLARDTDLPASPRAERLIMERLAEALSQRDLLISAAFARARH